ncbi:MAG TPA: HAMP domain-containing histidine kinase [Armatimonadetes bacterium]|nr:HAMP domain-containing histidine kinase [Armatimonadota bacterium]
MRTQIPIELTLLERIQWLMSLRWIAAGGVLVTALVTTEMLHIRFPFLPICLIALAIVGYNGLLWWVLPRLKRESTDSSARWVGWFVNLQIGLDWLALAALIHFSGGVENPFIFYFVFHMIIASILLSRRASYVHATLATGLVGMMGGLEYARIIPHVHLQGFLPAGFLSPTADLYNQPKYLLGMLTVFATTMYITVYLTTEITATLRRREEELAALKEQLEEANENLREQDRLKSEYVLLVSHNLKSPAAAAQSLLSVVLDGVTGPLEEKTRYFLQRAERRIYELLHLARDLLDLSRIKAAKELRLEPVELAEILWAAIEDMRLRAEDKNIALQIRVPTNLPLINGDKDHIEQAFINLLTNAIKYTPPGGCIEVKAHSEGEWIKVEVTDNGIGIPAEALPHIFDEFYRAPNAEAFEPDGTGLGLSLVKYIVERHGGEIEVESTEGEGTTFTFTLPQWMARK